jgi:fructose-1,6-bisphosphatase/inositol monophosphatase family enzyme
MIDDLRFASRLAEAADEITRRYLGSVVRAAQTKADGSQVTHVDLDVETRLLALVEQERPDDGFLGEEVGHARQGDRRWIIDGIDGTEAFIAQRPEWSTLIALEVSGALRVGVVSAPALSSRWWASSGDGAWTGQASDGELRDLSRLKVSAQGSLADSKVGVWPPAEALPGSRHDAAVRLAIAVQGNPVLRQARGGSTPGTAIVGIALSERWVARCGRGPRWSRLVRWRSVGSRCTCCHRRGSGRTVHGPFGRATHRHWGRGL